MKHVLFIDRDGTMIKEPADFQIDQFEKFALVEDVIANLLALQSAGYRLVMVTNQDGLGTARYTQESFEKIQTLLLQILASQGVKFDEILICPHLSADGCKCRKPQVGLVRHYLASNEMDRENSFVIGDRATDVQLAENMGIKGFLLSPQLGWPEIRHQILDRPRTATIGRKTKETEILVEVDLDAATEAKIHTGLGFFDHMLEQLSRHGGFGLRLEARGDLHVDDHHVIEDVALSIGAALKKALGDKRGISRYGFWLPMDEAEARVTIDLSGRGYFVFNAQFPSTQVAGLTTEMVTHFFRSLADSMAMSLHIEGKGENTHHMIESMFKAVGRTLKLAMSRNQNEAGAIPSTKGTL